jgi:hypothetical protein
MSTGELCVFRREACEELVFQFAKSQKSSLGVREPKLLGYKKFVHAA